MCPSTEVNDPQHAFATEVLRKLLHHIHAHNSLADADRGHYTFLVSHAWTDGPMIYVVYTAPPSNVRWGLVRDTRVSTIDPGPWPDVDEAVLFYSARLRGELAETVLASSRRTRRHSVARPPTSRPARAPVVRSRSTSVHTVAGGAVHRAQPRPGPACCPEPRRYGNRP